MAGSKGRMWPVALIVAGVALAVVAIVYWPDDGTDGEGREDEVASHASSTRREDDRRPRVNPVEELPPASAAKGGRPGHRDDPLVPSSWAAKLKELPSRPASGPLRFVARFGKAKGLRPGVTARSPGEALRLVESVRSRVIRGEDPIPLIRDSSDPPIGLDPELIEQYESLGAGEASPVVELDDGYAVFFGQGETQARADGGAAEAAAPSEEP